VACSLAQLASAVVAAFLALFSDRRELALALASSSSRLAAS